jgi:uncharacterized protein YecE (DUF72 family)
VTGGQLYVGTSGWGYAAWKGKFYPANLTADKMLPFYAERFNATELNNTFYRAPAADAVAKWRDTVSDGFRFAIKAPRTISFRREPGEGAEGLARFMGLMELLGSRRGPFLFQLPPTQPANVDKLAAFLELVKPYGQSVAFELRHPSWLAEPTFELLRAHDAALCLTEDDDSAAPLVMAGSFAYFRLRKSDYTEDELAAWRERFRDILAGGRDVYAFAKHEDEAKGPDVAQRLLG